MREIKFRAMQSLSTTVLNLGGSPKFVYGTGIFKDPVNTWLSSHDSNKPLAWAMEHHIINPETIGQYTGLKDKNGFEIYEGDIIRYWGGECAFGFHEYEGEFIIDENYPIQFLDIENYDEFYIIGNIYENSM